MEGWTKPDPASGKIKIKRTTAGIKGKSAENGVDFSAFYCGVFCPPLSLDSYLPCGVFKAAAVLFTRRIRNTHYVYAARIRTVAGKCGYRASECNVLLVLHLGIYPVPMHWPFLRVSTSLGSVSWPFFFLAGQSYRADGPPTLANDGVCLLWSRRKRGNPNYS